jgi:IS605 OrfB family transposase
VSLAKQGQLAVAREDLTGLVESLRRLPKGHRTALITLGYRRLGYWIDWQAEKNGVPILVVEPAGTSSTCPRCGSELVEVGHRMLRCPRCGLEADRDTIAILNIERRALSKMGGSLATPTAPQMTDVNPNGWGEPPHL